MTNGNPVVEMVGITKIYGKGEAAVVALHALDLRISEGEYIAIMGPSGSGKSTLMNIIGCLDRATEGKYLLDGVEVDKAPDSALARIRNQKVGFIFQQFNLLSRLNAQRNVELPLIYSGVSARERKARSAEILERVGLRDRMRHRPNELSGGQQQRVAIARALVTQPAIILADEPTGNLDTKSGAEILKLFRELADLGKTLIMVTHDPKVAKHARRVVGLLDGQRVTDEAVSQEETSDAAI